MKLLTFSSLYPNREMPSHGIFVENRLRHLIDAGRVASRVIAPVPWFPFNHPVFGRYAAFARVPSRELRFGIDVLHPPYPTVPGIGRDVAPLAMALAARPAVAALRRSGFDFDVIDAHYFYPDGVAAALLAKWFDRPLVITARGSDITHFPKFFIPRRMIRWAARRATAIVTVCTALKQDLLKLGADGNKLEVLRNGVDLRCFTPLEPGNARRALSLPAAAQVIASVGHLIPRKGHELVIETLAALPSVILLVVGSGPEQASLVALAERLGVADRVRFLGQLRQHQLPLVYSASDALVLASSNEGWANVLLEAMACGTPVVATDVGGSREVVDAPEAGVLVTDRTTRAVVDALHGLLAALPDRQATRRYAERFSWDETTRGQERLFATVLSMPMGESLDVRQRGRTSP